jgi:fermentation-respiration switch protein FrsA (DUF1100 family)
MGEARAPILLIAGSEGRHTTLEESRTLFDAAPKRSEFWILYGAGHESFHRFAGAEHERRILDFLKRYLDPSTA